MQEKLLALLKRKHDYISGEDISNDLGISRQALWKHIQELRDSGYDIVAVPHLGYKLDFVPDRLFPQEILHKLNTKFIGKKIHYFDKVSSTMDEAMHLGMNNAQEGTLIIAESQGRGRGRLGRLWDSPKYKGIYLSLILRPDILPNHCPTLTLLAAVSICEAVNLVLGLDCHIKWPNDILIHHKKVAGILTELNAEMDRVSFVLIGIGLNVNNEKKDLVMGATSLKEQKKENINRIELLQELLRCIEENYVIFQKEGPQIILEKWRKYSLTIGQRVKVACQKEQLEGEAVDIDSDGGLLIRQDSGIIEKVMSGDVVHCR